ncbi:MAG: DUF309 domain-containing protein [Herpetosiphon sp.]
MHEQELYREGIQRFNEGRYWDAHESWEDAWKTHSDSHIRLFFKGIIQTAAALVHWQRGNPKGLHLNWQKARPKLLQLDAIERGIPIPPLIAYMDRFVEVDGQGIAPPTLPVPLESAVSTP